MTLSPIVHVIDHTRFLAGIFEVFAWTRVCQNIRLYILILSILCAKMRHYRCLIYAKAQTDVTYMGPSIAPELH